MVICNHTCAETASTSGSANACTGTTAPIATLSAKAA